MALHSMQARKTVARLLQGSIGREQLYGAVESLRKVAAGQDRDEHLFLSHGGIRALVHVLSRDCECAKSTALDTLTVLCRSRECAQLSLEEGILPYLVRIRQAPRRGTADQEDLRASASDTILALTNSEDAVASVVQRFLDTETLILATTTSPSHMTVTQQKDGVRRLFLHPYPHPSTFTAGSRIEDCCFGFAETEKAWWVKP